MEKKYLDENGLAAVAEIVNGKETKHFTGTQAQWDALTDEQKKSYTIANITDDAETDQTTDTVETGNMLAVTSNAVDAICRSLFYDRHGGTTDFTTNTGTGIINRWKDGILTLKIRNTDGNGMDIDFDYKNGAIRLYKMENGVTVGYRSVTLSGVNP